MGTDKRLAGLLEEATGPAPGWGDMDDVRRRARRFNRRRRIGVAIGTAAAVVGGLLVAGTGPADRDPSGVATENVPAQGGAALGELLFERELPSGGTLRVRSTEVAGEVAVELPGSTEPLLLTPRSSRGDIRGSAAIHDPAGSPYMEDLVTEIGGRQWAIVTMTVCPGDPATEGSEARIWSYYRQDQSPELPQDEPPEGDDRMEPVDGLAVVAIPLPDDPARLDDRRLQVHAVDGNGNRLLGFGSLGVRLDESRSPDRTAPDDYELRCEAGR
jgi:hypothetical protein